MTIEARSTSEVGEYLNSDNTVPSGSHYTSELERHVALGSLHNVKTAAIPQDVYAIVAGSRLLDLVFSLTDGK